jgi:sulfur relay (sulfurtransferase) complex TusBCD TusD component (DsrE family)
MASASLTPRKLANALKLNENKKIVNIFFMTDSLKS